MDFSEINQLCTIFTESNDNDELEEVGHRLSEFKQQSESVVWVLSTYSTMDNIKIKKLQLTFMVQWFRKSWADFPHDIWEEFKKLLFVQANHRNIDTKDEAFYNLVIDAQLLFMWNSFPDMWPTFWQDYFQDFDDNSKLGFLYSFTNFSDGVEGKDNIIFKNVKDFMRSNKSDEAVANFITKTMKLGEKKAFEVFISLCSWVNCAYLLNDESVSIIKSALESEDYCQHALKILARLMNRGIPYDCKFEIIKELEIPSRIEFILGNTSDGGIIEAAASLINSIGQELINSPEFFLQTYNLAMGCLVNSDYDVSSDVFPFLEAVCKKEGCEDASKNILLEIIKKLEMSFEDIDSYEFNVYLEKLTVLSNKALRANHQENVVAALELFDDGRLLESKMNRAISIIYIVSKNLSNGQSEDLIRYAIEKFQIILKVDKVDNPIISFGVVNFITFFVAVGDIFQKEEVSPIFRDLCQLVLSSTDSDGYSFHSDLAASLNHFIKKLNSKIDKNFDNSIITDLIDSHEEQLIRVAGSLISAISPENQANVFKASIDKLLEMFGNIAEESKESFVPTIFSFVKAMKDVQDASLVQYISNILHQFIEPCSNNDKLFELLIRTAHSSLGDNCLPVIQECASCIDVGNYSCISFCKVMTSIIKSDKIPKAEWIGEIIDYLYGIVTPKFDSLQFYDLDSKQIDLNKEIIELACSYIKLFSHAMNLANEYIEEQTYNRMKQFLAESLSKYFDIPDLDVAIIEFISSVSKMDFDSICNDGFIKYAVNFLYAGKFDPTQKEWHKVIIKLLSFHQHLLELSEGGVKHLIMQSLAEFIDNSVTEKANIIESYFSIFLEKQPRDQKARGKEYFVEFKKVMISQLS